MNTTIYLYCVSHEPRISSGEVGRWTSDLPQIRELISQRDELIKTYNAMMEHVWQEPSNDRSWTAIRFFVGHPHCELEIWDEYGKQYPLVAEDEEPVKDFDYKTLLIKYIRHVGECQGETSFVNEDWEDPQLFTAAEWATLENLEEKVNDHDHTCPEWCFTTAGHMEAMEADADRQLAEIEED